MPWDAIAHLLRAAVERIPLLLPLSLGMGLASLVWPADSEGRRNWQAGAVCALVFWLANLVWFQPQAKKERRAVIRRELAGLSPRARAFFIYCLERKQRRIGLEYRDTDGCALHEVRLLVRSEDGSASFRQFTIPEDVWDELQNPQWMASWKDDALWPETRYCLAEVAERQARRGHFSW